MKVEFDCPGGYYMLGDLVSAASAEEPVPGQWGDEIGSASMYGVFIIQFGRPRRVSLDVRFHEDIETASLGDITPSMENPDPGWEAAEVLRGGLREGGDLDVIVDGRAIAQVAAASGRYGYTLTLRRRPGAGDHEEHQLDVYPCREPVDPRPIVSSRDAEVRKSSREALHTDEGFYTLVSGFRRFFEVLPDPVPRPGLSIEVGDRMAWVFPLGETRTREVQVTVYQADAEPADVLARLRKTHPHEAHLELDNDSTGLDAIGSWRGDHPVTVAAEGRHRIVVFARRRENKWGDLVEEHILVSWPASQRAGSGRAGRVDAPQYTPTKVAEAANSVSSSPRDVSGPPSPESYVELVEAIPDTESLTVLVVAGKSRAQVLEILQIDPDTEVPDGDSDDPEVTGWALANIPGGVLGLEHTGYGDPTLNKLRKLSEDGGAAAVVRNNVMAHLRFGCARDGELLFDDDEFMYTDHPETVPAELRELFDLVYDDFETDDTEHTDEPGEDTNPFAVGLAMSEAITGIRLILDDITTVQGSGYFAGPTQDYTGEL